MVLVAKEGRKVQFSPLQTNAPSARWSRLMDNNVSVRGNFRSSLKKLGENEVLSPLQSFPTPAQHWDKALFFLLSFFNIPVRSEQPTGTNEWLGIFKWGGLLLFIEKSKQMHKCYCRGFLSVQLIYGCSPGQPHCSAILYFFPPSPGEISN